LVPGVAGNPRVRTCSVFTSPSMSTADYRRGMGSIKANETGEQGCDTHPALSIIKRYASSNGTRGVLPAPAPLRTDLRSPPPPARDGTPTSHTHTHLVPCAVPFQCACKRETHTSPTQARGAPLRKPGPKHSRQQRLAPTASGATVCSDMSNSANSSCRILSSPLWAFLWVCIRGGERGAQKTSTASNRYGITFSDISARCRGWGGGELPQASTHAEEQGWLTVARGSMGAVAAVGCTTRQHVPSCPCGGRGRAGAHLPTLSQPAWWQDPGAACRWG
jgi:hypothetical protein